MFAEQNQNASEEKRMKLSALKDVRKMDYESFQKINPKIVEHNMLIKSRTNVTFNQFRLILLAISNIKINDDHFEMNVWKATDLAKVLNIPKENCYREVKNAVRDLTMKAVFIFIPELNKEKGFPWLSISEYEEGKGLVGFKLNYELKPYLLNLKKNFTIFGNEILTCFKTQNTLAFFMYAVSLLKKQTSFTHNETEGVSFFINIDDLKHQFFLKNNYRTNNIVPMVLRPIKEEIESRVPYKLNYKAIRKGKVIIGYEFSFAFLPEKTIESNQELKEIPIGACLARTPEGVNDRQYQFIYKKMLSLGVKYPENLIKTTNYDLPRIWATINYVLYSYVGVVDATAIPKILNKAITDNYLGVDYEKWLKLPKKAEKEQQ